MNITRSTWIGLGALVIIVGLVWYYGSTTPDTGSVSNAEEAAIRTQVMEFGRKMQNVSLLASTDNRKAAMGANYAAYVAPELLASWYPEGAAALGRYASSPWPDSIDIVEVRADGANYVVEGNVLEVASGTGGQPEPVAVYPVTLTLEKRGDVWMIIKMRKGAYSQLPHSQVITGFWECLPHKDTSGPQTLECALGIAVDQSDGHYAIDTTLMSAYPDYTVGTKVRVTGIVTPANTLSSPQKYDIDGIIRATLIEKL